MTYKCVWDVNDDNFRHSSKCGKKATYWIIGGCLDGHLMDLPLCTEHTKRFCDMFAQNHIGCRMCTRSCEEYDIVVAEKVTHAGV